MRRLRAACCMGITIVMLFAGTASASQFRWLHWTPHTILVTPRGSAVGGRWQQWLSASAMPTPPGRLTFALAPCPDWGGYAEACASADEMWLNASAMRREMHPSWLMRATLLHEIGHVFDDRVLTDSDRLAFMRLWGAKVRPGETVAQNWNHGEAEMSGMVFGEYPPVEWFAEGYRLCASYRRWTSDAAENEQNDVAYANNGRFVGIDYDYPAAWSARYDSSNRRVPRRRRLWSLRSQRATCTLIERAAIRSQGMSSR